MPDDPPQDPVAELERLARARFPKPRLRKAEIKLVRAAPKGDVAVCGPNEEWNDPANDPGKAKEWGPERQIRADLIRWICVDRRARELVDPKGIQVFGANVPDSIDLQTVTIPFCLTLQRCCLTGELNLRGAQMPMLDLQGTRTRAIGADCVVVKGDVFLRKGFHAEGEVRLLGAQIGGQLNCSGATFENPPLADMSGSGGALCADRALVRGSVLFTRGFSAKGTVRFLGAQIEGSLDCEGATFDNPAQEGVTGNGDALNADRAVVKGNVFLRNGFSADGHVRLTRTEIDGDFDCGGATFNNPAQAGAKNSGNALSADGTIVKGYVFLHNGFSARGEVRLLGAQIGGDLNCVDAWFENPRQAGGSGDALSADGAAVKGNIFLTGGFSAKGTVRLLGAQIGGDLDCRGAKIRGTLTAQTAVIKGTFFWAGIDPEEAALDLISTSVGTLVDHAKSWPAKGNLILDGFVYGRIFGGAPKDVTSRLDWLARQKPFTPQPYRQLAKVLTEEGDDEGSRAVLFKMECLRRAARDRKWHQRLKNWTLRKTIGYGYYPRRSLWALTALWVLGFLVFWSGYCTGSMAPTQKEAYDQFKVGRQLPAQYDRFHALVYSFESSFPLVKLGQADLWQPDPSPQQFVTLDWRHPISIAAFLRWFRWAQILSGWFFATMGVAGVSGLLRED